MEYIKIESESLSMKLFANFKRHQTVTKCWRKITLISPSDKGGNINFYTKKCGFIIDRTDMDGNVKVVHFLMER